MRTKYSPTRTGTIPLPPKPDYSLCVVTHYEDHPWYKEIPDIVDLSIQTMLEGAKGSNYEFILWDNGSPKWFCDKLEKYDPHIFVKSYNAGNWNARRSMLRMARGEIVNLADCDILYRKDWLMRAVEVLKTYPNIGLVTGNPVRYASYNSNTVEWACKNTKLITTVFPTEWDRQNMVSRHKPEMFQPLGKAMKIEYKGVRAWVCTQDAQFVAYKKTMEVFYCHPSENLFDRSGLVKRINDAGLLQLATAERTAMHMGNTIDASIQKVMAEMGIDR